MYTDCPSCRRQFRIRAGHLSAAAGLVQCGYCGKRFNALARLHDRPLPPPQDVPVMDERPDAADESRVDIPPPPGEEEHFTSDQPVDKETDAGARHDRPVLGDEPGSGPDEMDQTAEEAIPPELLPEGRHASGWSRVLWSLGVVILLLAASVQLAWFNRDMLLARYPQLMPWARQACEHLQCDLIRHRDLSAIQVVNRDVRDHPRYEQALLVNATIVNNSKGVQAFPVVRLSLFDTAGKLIAYRRFTPTDYLDTSIAIDRGMPPDKPVHIVLEVVGPTEGAVGFEFEFLQG